MSSVSLGVCQRDDSAFYDYLKEEHQKQKDGPEYSEFVSLQQEDLRAEIQRFFIDNISGKFCDNDCKHPSGLEFC